MVLASITATSAAPIEPDWGIDVNWENTVKLGTILQPTSPYRNANPYCLPADRGTIDRHVIAKYVCGGASGLTSGGLDWRSALDLADGDLGGHVSLSGW